MTTTFSHDALIYISERTLIHFPLAEAKGDVVVRYEDIKRIYSHEGRSFLVYYADYDRKTLSEAQIAWNPETAQHEINDQVLHALTPWEHRTDPKVVEMSEAARAFIRSMNES